MCPTDRHAPTHRHELRAQVRRPSVKQAVCLCVLCCVAGCATPENSLRILDYREGAAPRRYVETFDEAYYCFDEADNVDIVLRKARPLADDRTQDIVQVVHVHGVWRSIPGRTVADSTQINATVSYMILSGGVGATYEGAGAVLFREDRREAVLTGTVEHAVLKPLRRRAGGADVFHQAELNGRFEAVRDRRRTLAILHDMERRFGPRPPSPSTHAHAAP